MLYLVLVLVIGAFVLLITALATANTLWAWVSVGISVVAAGLLVYDWVRGRRRVAATSAPRAVDPADNGAALASDSAPQTAQRPAQLSDHRLEPVAASGREHQTPDRFADEPTSIQAAAGDVEPGEEATDATDLLVISGLGVEVRVVDEHPRYHLTQCTWLTGRQTIPLPVAEARELGFTPCARCGPDGVLAARHRAGRGATQ